MTLKQFTPDTVTSRRSTTPSCSINIKAGLFGFSKSACELIGLAADDKVIFHQDEEDPECWYIEKAKDQGFVLRAKDDTNTGLFFNNCSIARLIAKSLAVETNGFRLIIGGNPTDFGKHRKLWGLLNINVKSK